VRQDADAQVGGNHLTHGIETSDLNTQTQWLACRCCGLRSQFEQGTAPVGADERVLQTVCKSKPLALGQGMIPRTHHHQLIGLKRLDGDAVSRRAVGEHANVGNAVHMLWPSLRKTRSHQLALAIPLGDPADPQFTLIEISRKLETCKLCTG
jgi:hypothetical protein